METALQAPGLEKENIFGSGEHSVNPHRSKSTLLSHQDISSELESGFLMEEV